MQREEHQLQLSAVDPALGGRKYSGMRLIVPCTTSARTLRIQEMREAN